MLFNIVEFFYKNRISGCYSKLLVIYRDFSSYLIGLATKTTFILMKSSSGPGKPYSLECTDMDPGIPMRPMQAFSIISTKTRDNLTQKAKTFEQEARNLSFLIFLLIKKASQKYTKKNVIMGEN